MTLEQFLQTFHRGESNAIKSGELEKIFNCSGGEIRKQVNLLRTSGIPICSTGKGYFYASTMKEAKDTLNQLTSRINKISAARKGILTAMKRGELLG